MTTTYYSTDGETFHYGSARDAATDEWKSGDAYNIGDTVDIWKGDASKCFGVEFLPNIAEHLVESAFDEFSEYAEDWVISVEDEKQLQELVEKSVSDWMTKTNNNPSFWRMIGDPVKLRYRYVDADGGVKLAN